MAFSTLVIHPISGSLEWSIHDERGCGEIQRIPAGESLSALPRQPAIQQTHLLLPVEMAIFRKLEIPSSGYVLTPQKLQWLADETLDESSAALHWTIIQQQDSDVWVAGIEPCQLEAQLLPFTTAGIKITHATLDALCLPITDEGWTVLKDEEGWLVRPHAGRGSRLNEHWLTHLLAHYAPQQLTCYGPLPDSNTRGNTYPEQSILSVYTPATTINLLHGHLRLPMVSQPGTMRLKRLALGYVLALTIMPLISQILLYTQLHWLEQQLTTALTQNWHSYIPENRHSANLRTYLPKQLQQRFPAPAILLQRLQKGMDSFPQLALKGINYDQQRKSLQIFMYASDKNQIEQFITANATGLPLQIEKQDQGLWTLRYE